METENEEEQKEIADMEFTDVSDFRNFITDTGKILPRKYTGLTPRQQRDMAKKVKVARQMLLMK